MQKLNIAAAIVLNLSACTQINSNNTISLQSAMVSTADALSAAQQEIKRLNITGFNECDITATFDVISLSDGTLGISLDPPKSPIGFTGKLEHSTQLGNTVTIDYKSPACISALAKQPSTVTTK